MLVVMLSFLLFSPAKAYVESPVSISSDQNDFFTPNVWKPAWVDQYNNGIADSLDQEIADRIANGTAQEYANVIVMLKAEPTIQDADDFISCGGYLTTPPWTEAIYGFGGMIPYNAIANFTQRCPNVLLVEKEAIGEATVAYAAQQVGARTYVWNTVGLQGDPNSSIAVVDTGIDGSHVDFAPGYGDENFSKKIVGWNDQVGSTTSPVDDNGHGSHCAGLAAGDGFFSVDASGNATTTWGTNLGSVSSSGTYLVGGMMVNKTGTITINVTWARTGTASLSALRLYYGDKTLSTGSWTQVASVSTPSQNNFYSLTYNVAATPSGGYDMYQVLMTLTAGTGDLYAAFNMSWPYTPPSDGFSAWTGIAPQSKLVGVKTQSSTGSGTSTAMVNGINWIISNRMTYHITVASISIGWPSEESSVDSAVLNLVNSGVTTVIAAGNDGSGANYIYTPGSVDEVISVAAMNQFDNIASYSSQGGTSHSTGKTTKPDITAPGGSFFGVPLFSVDSNCNDAEGQFTEIQANDSAPMQGTSMATPVVAGAASIIVQAMGGYSAWNWTRNQALFPKTILLMTATETYPNLRESSSSTYSPTLDRGAKDAHEGYGRLNLDAAADAVLKTYNIGTTVSDTLGRPPTLADISVLGQRLAWARNVQLVSGITYNFALSVPSGADYDLYLYDTTGNTYGEPVIVANSTTATVGGSESITYIPPKSGEYYVVVKRATEDTGAGQFTLTSSAHDDWTMFRHELQHTGYSTSTAPNTNNTLWSYTTGDAVYSPLAVADGKVYVGSDDHKIYCLNATNGAHIWSYTTGSWVESSPAVADGKVYVGSCDGNVYCLNATDGAYIWSYTTGNYVVSSPAVADGKVYVGSRDYKVYCLNATDGAYIWSYTTGADVFSSPAVADGKVYVGSRDYKVYCLNASTGAYIWSYTTGNYVYYSSPAVADDKVYVGSNDHKIYCLNATNGAHIWSYTTGNYVESSPAVAYGKVYVGSNDFKVYCLNATNGAYIWSYTTGPNVGSPAVADGKVYVGSSNYKVYCLNAANGAYIWSYTTGDDIYHSSPAVAYGRVYVGSRDNKVYCFGLPVTPSLVVRGQDNRIYYRSYNSSSGSWGSWNAFPSGSTCDNPAAAICNNELHVVVRSMDGSKLWHRYVNLATTTFSGWTLLSGFTPSAPTLTSNGTHLCLVVRGGDNRIYHCLYNVASHSWGGWSALPSGSTGDSPAAALVGNELHVVVRGMSGSKLYHSYRNLDTAAFSGWTMLSGSSPSAPTLASNSTHLSLVVRGGDDRIYHRFCNASSHTWGGWSVLSSGSTGDRPAAAFAGDQLQFVVRGSTGGKLYHSYVSLASATFSGWSLLTGTTPSPPTLTS
jgi:outer membrane protein assembly factor BamB/subtilisin family serine protease